MLRPRVLLTCFVALVAAPPAGAADDLVLGDPVVVSVAPPFPGCATPDGTPLLGSEPSVAVDPADPRRVAVAWVQGENVAIMATTSDDGGKTFGAAVPVPGVSRCSGGTDDRISHPRLAFGPGGELWLSTFTRMDGTWGAVARGLVSRSGDGGRTWSPPRRVDLADAGAGADVDDFAVDPRNGDLLVIGSPAEVVVALEPTVLARSADGGETWVKTVVRVAPSGTSAWNTLVVRRDGRVVVVFADAPLAEFVTPEPVGAAVGVTTSSDGGRSWSEAVSLGRGTALHWTAAAAAPDGTLHAAWIADGDGGTCRRLGGPAGGRCRIQASRSANDGRTWSKPRTAAAWAAPASLPAPGLATTEQGTAGVLVMAGAAEGADVRARVSLVSADGGFADSPLGAPFSTAAVPDRLGLQHEVAGTRCGFVAAFVEDRRPGSDVVVQRARVRGCR